jgi:hypothetical protein
MMAKIVKRRAAVSVAILIASVPVVLPSEVYAQTAHSLSVSGTGRESCATWTNAREGTSEEAKLDAQKRIEWVTGFFTAVNLFTQPSGNLHGSIDDQDGMLGWIDVHCRANPNEPLFAAAAGLVLDIKNHPRK